MTDHDALYAGETWAKLRDPKSNEAAQIQYTSGTTGFPNGASLHHHGLERNGFEAMNRAGIGQGESFVHNMPLFHTTGCAISVLGGLGNGATMLLAPMFDPVIVADAIDRERTTFIMGVPTMLVAMIDEVRRSGRDVSSIKSVMSGGAMVVPQLCRAAQAVLGAPIQIVYGQIKTSPF